MAKKKPKKTGVLTLRIPPEVHRDLAQTAAELGLDLTGLIRLMIRRTLPHFQLEARLIAFQGEEASNLLETWRRDNPGRPIREFWDDYYRHQKMKWMKELKEFQHDPRYTMDEAFAAAVIDPFSPSREPDKERPTTSSETPRTR